MTTSRKFRIHARISVDKYSGECRIMPYPTRTTQQKDATMTANQINEYCTKVYGHGILEVNPLAALWVAERILNETGKSVYKTISRKRDKHGKGTTFPEYGTPLFNTL